jgi:hypothetical protein
MRRQLLYNLHYTFTASTHLELHQSGEYNRIEKGTNLCCPKFTGSEAAAMTRYGCLILSVEVSAIGN